MLLTSLRVENFKRFERLEIDLRPLDCLVGPNNSGKTTLLQALALFGFCVQHCLTRKNGTFELKRRSISPEEFYVLPVSDPMDLWTDRKTIAARRQKIIQISVTFDRDRSVTASVKLDYNRFGVVVESSDESQQWFDQLAGLRIEYLPVFSVFLAQEERRTPAVIEDELTRGRVHGVIRNLILDLKERDRHEELIAILRRSFRTLKDMRIRFDEVSDRYISVSYHEDGHPKEFDVFSAGSGFQQFLYLFGFVLLRDPTIILLDEPDVHLHGTLQRALLHELQNLVKEGKQVLFATHSRDLIGGTSPENVISLEEGGAKRLCVEYDVYDTLDRLGSIEPTQLAVVQAFQRVLIMEDQVDWALLSVFCAKCLGPAVWQDVERRLAVCYSKGNPYKQPIVRLREQLQQMISLPGQTLEAFVVSDRDYYPDLGQLREQLPSDHLRWHVWERAEIENYLLCPDAIIRLLREGHDQPVLEEPGFREQFGELLEASRDPIFKQLVNAFDVQRRRLEKKWDAGTMADKARDYLQQNWEDNRRALADAKDVVLPGIKRWLQEHELGQFSNKSLAQVLLPEDLPEEVHDLAAELADFTGVTRS